MLNRALACSASLPSLLCIPIRPLLDIEAAGKRTHPKFGIHPIILHAYGIVVLRSLVLLDLSRVVRLHNV